MKLGFVGVGYVGLVSGTGLASQGHDVFFYDLDQSKLNFLSDGKIPFYEPGLEELFRKNKERIMACRELRQLVENSEIIFLAVGTPSDDKGIDLSFVIAAIEEIAQILADKNHIQKILVIKSTVLPGTTETVIKPILLKYRIDSNRVGLCMNPEFLREGEAVEDFMYPDRIVLGTSSQWVSEKMLELYKSYKCKKILTNTNTAEMIKYTSNTYLALNISFANEIANICENLDHVDPIDVIEGMTYDRRIVNSKNSSHPDLINYLKPGCGFGGSCFPKDVKALFQMTKKMNNPSTMIQSILDVNEKRTQNIWRKGLSASRRSNPIIGVLGLAFKPNTDDIRESPAIKLINFSIKQGLQVLASDPMAIANTKKMFHAAIDFKTNYLDVVENADIIYLVTPWNLYIEHIADILGKMKSDSILVDCRRALISKADDRIVM